MEIQSFKMSYNCERIIIFLTEQIWILIKTGVFTSNAFAHCEISSRVIYVLVYYEAYISLRNVMYDNNKVLR